MNFATPYTHDERYVINPQKTVILPFNIKSKSQVQSLEGNSPWDSNATPILVKDAMVHLGVKRHISDSKTIMEDRRARGVVYSMIGVGLQGYSALPVPTCISLYSSYMYIVPNALCGVEVIRITDPAKQNLSHSTGVH